MLLFTNIRNESYFKMDNIFLFSLYRLVLYFTNNKANLNIVVRKYAIVLFTTNRCNLLFKIRCQTNYVLLFLRDIALNEHGNPNVFHFDIYLSEIPIVIFVFPRLYVIVLILQIFSSPFEVIHLLQIFYFASNTRTILFYDMLCYILEVWLYKIFKNLLKICRK